MLAKNNMSNHHRNSDKTLCLIIDDNPRNLQVLGEQLRAKGYDISVAVDGEKGLKISEMLLPDIILLDVMMPGMDGYEVCKKLKENPNTKDIPVIFLTAKVASEDIVKGFELGAVDYVTKPFNHLELLARVDTHTKLKRYRERIESDKLKLAKLNQDKNEFLGIAAHDLKNPIFSISMIAKVLLETDEFDPEEINGFAEDIIKSADKVLDLITALLDINAIEEGKMKFYIERLPLDSFVKSTIESFKESASSKNINILYEQNAEDTYAAVDERAIKQILDNLISNAVKYSYFDTDIQVRLTEKDETILIEIENKGKGIKPEEMDKLFGKFVKLSTRPTAGEHSSGLGLSIVKNYIEQMNGKVWCESEYLKSTSFYIELPKESNDEE